jgi:adenylosuccinate synthase
LLAEGAQGYWLDVEQGWWPFVTSSDTTTAGIPKGLGVAPWHVNGAMGVVKAYKSRVGDGPFITEFDDPVLTERVRGPAGAVDRESGTTTGRDRRLGWLDAVEVRQANEINGTEQIALTRLDSLEAFGKSMRIAVAYKKAGELSRNFPESVYELPEPVYSEVGLWTPDMTPHIRSARTYAELARPVRNLIDVIEQEIEADIVLIGTGPGRDQIIDRR